MTVSDRPHPPEGPAVTRQVDLYGLSWSERLHGLMAAYRLTQGRLAAAIGLSAPMVSQLISGQRVKISNPSVYARVVRLEELAGTPAVRSGDQTEIDRALAEVAGTTPTLTTAVRAAGPVSAGVGDEPLLERLSTLDSAETLERAAAAVAGTALGAVLTQAAGRARGR